MILVVACSIIAFTYAVPVADPVADPTPEPTPIPVADPNPEPAHVAAVAEKAVEGESDLSTASTHGFHVYHAHPFAYGYGIGYPPYPYPYGYPGLYHHSVLL